MRDSGNFFPSIMKILFSTTIGQPVLSQIEDEIITKSNCNCETYIKDFIENVGLNSNVIWKIISIDPEGFNLRAGYEILRINFQNTIERTNDMVKEFLEYIEFRLNQQELHTKENKATN